MTRSCLPGGQPAADLEPLVAELGDALHDDLVLPTCPRAALLRACSKGAVRVSEGRGWGRVYSYVGLVELGLELVLGLVLELQLGLGVEVRD